VNLEAAFKVRIVEELTLDGVIATKEKLLEKLASFNRKLVTQTRWNDYSSVE